MMLIDLESGANATIKSGYIYTSGTTGLPKAAIILHAKIFGFGWFFLHHYGRLRGGGGG